MNLPRFYEEVISSGSGSITLNEESSRHILQVLRMKPGEQLQVTDGKGSLHTAEIVHAGKKAAEVKLLATDIEPAVSYKVSIAISLVKNTSRFEWFLEKATEIGVHEVIPLICERTEKQHFRLDRMKNILVSAMLQSQQQWLPVLHEPVQFMRYLPFPGYSKKYVAHCIPTQRHSLGDTRGKEENVLACIGPEGDFTSKEIDAALAAGFIPVSLGETRLRTETAGIVAATLLRLGK